MTTKRRYSDEDKATALAALDANEGNVAKTARQLGIPNQTLDEWAKGRVSTIVPNIRDNKKKDLASRLEEIAWAIADSLPDKIAEAKLQQAATSLAIVVDKMQLLRGEDIPDTNDDAEDAIAGLEASLSRFIDRHGAPDTRTGASDVDAPSRPASTGIL